MRGQDRVKPSPRAAKFEFLSGVKNFWWFYAGADGPEDWSAWRLLLSPARPAFAPLGLAGVGCFDAGLPVDGVVGADDATSFLGGDGAAVGVAQDVVLAGAPTGGDAGEQDGGDVADRRVVVSFGVHEPLVFRGGLRVGFAGLGGGGEEGFAQQCVAGLGEPVVVFCLSGLADLGDQAGIGADGGQGVEPVRVADAAGDV